MVLKRRLDEVSRVAIHFQRQIRVEKFQREDGVALAHDLIYDTYSLKSRMKRFKEVSKRSMVFRQMKAKYPAFEVIMSKAMEGHLAMSKSVSTKLVCLSDKEAKQIGRNLMPALKSKKLASSGIDQWRRQNRAVRDLIEIYPFLEPMFEELAHAMVKTAPWGLMWRVFIGALLSLTDLTTDLIVLLNFKAAGKSELVTK